MWPVFRQVIIFRVVFLLQNEIRPHEKAKEEPSSSGAVEELLEKEKGENAPKGAPVEVWPTWIPAFVNEPFVVAMITTFSTIFLQGKLST